MILESVVPVPMIRENNKKFLEISEFKMLLLFCYFVKVKTFGGLKMIMPGIDRMLFKIIILYNIL